METWRAYSEGYFLIERAEGRWNKYPDAILLHYGRADNKWYEPSRFLRDYLIQPYSNNPNILLGKAYFALFPFIGFFFILERINQ